MRIRVIGVRSLVISALVAAGLSTASPALADVHLMKITEIFAMGSSQYVELRMHSSDQDRTNGTELRSFDEAGVLQTTVSFTSNVANGSSQDSILISSTGAETLFGVQADFDNLPASFLEVEGGKVCFHDTVLHGTIDCVAWGSYDGPAGTGSSAVGRPFAPLTGIPAGAAASRNLGGNGTLEASDDSGDSRNDFRFAAASPTNNSDASGSAGSEIEFASGSYRESESQGPAPVAVLKSNTTGDVSAVVNTVDDTAIAPGDYTALVDESVSWTDGDGASKDTPVTFTPDDEPEPHEQLLIRLDLESGDAVLGSRPVAVIVIEDDDDVTPPETEITKPRHRGKYRPGKVQTLTGSATDDAALQEVFLALRQRIRGGGCKWWTGQRFVNRACSSKRFFSGDDLDGSQGDSWSHRLTQKLKPSVGRSRIANYTLYARSEDQQANRESTFEAGRNANTFEVT